MRRSSFPLSSCLFLAATALLPISSVQASTISVYSNFSEDPAAGLGAYPYACSDPQCDNIEAVSVEWYGQYDYGSYGLRGSGEQIAMPFTVTGTQDLYLSEVQLAMYKFPDGTSVGDANAIGANHDNLTIQIVSDADGLPSGNVLEVLSVNPAIAKDGETFLNLSSTSHPVLEAGAQYWIEALPTTFDTVDTDEDTIYGWIENQEGAQYNYTLNQWNIGYNDFNGGWTGFYNQPSLWPAPSLNVFATTSLQAETPEPATITMAGMALAGIALGRLLIRRKRARP